MAKSKKIARLQGIQPAGARGCTAQTRSLTQAARGNAREDRRDTSKMYTNNQTHRARGNTPRADVKTRKR